MLSEESLMLVVQERKIEDAKDAMRRRLLV
jgi:hypothetical protein